MEIKSESGNFTLETMGMIYPNAFLYDALIKGDENLVQWYCNRMYELTTCLLTDQGLADDVQKALNKYGKRLQVIAEQKAKEVTEEEERMAAEQVKANIEYANMTKKQRKEYKKSLREELRNMSNEND
jgi:deoxyribodipyrimidine photolyase